MANKRKKNTLALERPILPKITVPPEGVEQDLIVHNLIKIIGNLGFQQVVLPPVEERKIFSGLLPSLAYRDKILEVASSQLDLVLCPTYLPILLRKYLQLARERGTFVAKWFYLSPLLQVREDKQEIFHELGIFILGEDSSLANAQLINTMAQVLGELGITDLVTEINSMGCANCQRDYHRLLQDYLTKQSFDLCKDCQANLAENWIAVWNCPISTCQSLLASAPQIVDVLDDPCRRILIGVLETLDELGISYNLNPLLSYPDLSQKLLFRMSFAEGKVVLGSGGNYGVFTPKLSDIQENLSLLGFLTSLEKFCEYVPAEKRRVENQTEVFIISLGGVASRRALLLQRELKEAGIKVGEAMLGTGGIRNQLKEAMDHRSEIALIIGQKEAIDETVILRDIRSSMQELFAYDRIIEEVKKRLGK